MSRERQTVSLATMMGKGISCASCGASEDWSVYETRKMAGYVQRKRHCRHCGTDTLTAEYARQVLLPVVKSPGDEQDS